MILHRIDVLSAADDQFYIQNIYVHKNEILKFIRDIIRNINKREGMLM